MRHCHDQSHFCTFYFFANLSLTFKRIKVEFKLSDFLKILRTLNWDGHLRRAAALDVTYRNTLVNVGRISERLQKGLGLILPGVVSQRWFLNVIECCTTGFYEKYVSN